MSISERQELKVSYKIYERSEMGLLLSCKGQYDRRIYDDFDGYTTQEEAIKAIQTHADENGYAGIRDLIIVPEVIWGWKDGY